MSSSDSSSSDSEVELFESASADASYTYPVTGGKIQKGGFVMVRSRPCKVDEVKTSKTGKHGHAKATIKATDIFTAKKLVDSFCTSHSVMVPNVQRSEYTLVYVDEENSAMSLLTDEGTTKCDLDLPKDEKLRAGILAHVEAGDQLQLSVVAACGEEQVVSFVVEDCEDW